MAKKARPVKPTIRVRASNRRAGKEAELLLYRLQRFVNLGDDPAVWERFGGEYPRFFPVLFYALDDEPQQDDEVEKGPGSYEQEFYELFRVFRDMLRELWRSGSDRTLAVLLG